MINLTKQQIDDMRTSLGKGVQPFMKEAIDSLCALAVRGLAVPEERQIMDEKEVRALAKKLRLPKYWWDTEEGRMDLARFANEAARSPRGKQ